MIKREGFIFTSDEYADGSHPIGGNFGLLEGGKAFYGGALYYRYGYAPQEAVKKQPDEPEIEAPFAVGDRVIYTPPETFYGHTGADVATPGLTGEHGTVQEVRSADVVLVRWDNQGSLVHTVEFLSPAPTHKHPEGLYYARGSNSHVVIRHEAAPGSYAILYVDDTTADGEVPVNLGMGGTIVGSYDLVAAYEVTK